MAAEGKGPLWAQTAAYHLPSPNFPRCRVTALPPAAAHEIHGRRATAAFPSTGQRACVLVREDSHAHALRLPSALGRSYAFAALGSRVQTTPGLEIRKVNGILQMGLNPVQKRRTGRLGVAALIVLLAV